MKDDQITFRCVRGGGGWGGEWEGLGGRQQRRTGGCGERRRPRLRTLSEGGDGAAGLLLALQEAVLGLGGDLIDQMAVVGVWVHRQQLLLSDQVGGLQKNHRFIKIRNAVDECFVFPLMFLC